MKPHQRQLFNLLVAPLLALPDQGPDLSLQRLLQRFIAADPGILSEEDGLRLESACRIIDVRGKLPVEIYIDGSYKKPGGNTADALAAGLVAVLLASASANSADRGWRLKCANTALKALDLLPELQEHHAVMAWAIESVERVLSESFLP